jgi:hypothetical protein
LIGLLGDFDYRAILMNLSRDGTPVTFCSIGASKFGNVPLLPLRIQSSI